MEEYKIALPQLGEGVIEGILTNWLVKIGQHIKEEDSVAEIATDKVDSEVSTPHSGTVKALLFEPNEVIKVGEPMVVLELDKKETESAPSISSPSNILPKKEVEKIADTNYTDEKNSLNKITSSDERFYSPLVKNIAQQENISSKELDALVGSGAKGRVTKDDILSYVDQRDKNHERVVSSADSDFSCTSFSSNGEDEIIEMDRMRKIIAAHMVDSKKTSPHVSSFVEADLTKVVLWRDKIKESFMKKEGMKITFTPIFIQAIARAIKDYPMINIQTDGERIIRKKNINIGMAVALPSGNLIVPVIKNADQYNLTGLVKKVNDFAKRAKNHQLNPEEIKHGTYTMTNIGSFGNIFGIPIINQPQVAILAIGAIVKKPAVIETSEGDVIGIRHKVILSHSYDHRVVDGALGGLFVKRVAEYLENFRETI